MFHRKVPSRDQSGTVIKWFGSSLDIEDRKQIEFYLAEGQRLAHTGSWVFHADGFGHWSPELFAIHGLDPRGAPPTIPEYIALLHPDDREFVAQGIQRSLAEHSAFDFTKRIVRPDGSIRHVRCVGMPSTHGTFVGTGIDLTEHEQLTQALRKSEEELRQTLDLAPQLIGVFGSKRERLYLNRRSLEYLGVSLDEWRRRSFGSEMHPDDVEPLRALAEQSMSSGLPYELELRLRGSDGSHRWFLARYNPVRDENGQIIRWYVASTDIDDRKRAEERLKRENVALREDIDSRSMFEEIVGTSPLLQALLSQVSKVAPTDSTVLITGETGTGKELVARAIHKRSQRAERAFVRVSCAAIPPSLIASELFGHEKGAFTGATQRRLGRFELADGGTLFLDEVGEVPPETQIALLRVLQEREFDRVGGSQPVSVDVRVVAATNRDLRAAVEAGTFRRDLFYRLNVFPIEVPPLRDRKEDIPLLVEYLTSRYASKAAKKITRVEAKALDLLKRYDWPGNIRELQNVVERAIVVCDGDTLSVDESWLQREARQVEEVPRGMGRVSPEEERRLIEVALAACRGRVYGAKGAAAKLGLPRSTVESRIRSLGIDKHRFKSALPGSDSRK
jgi:formate hydrogenlyase transcriptional activator